MHAALKEMHRQVGDLVVTDGVAVRGMIIRHLVLPGKISPGVTGCFPGLQRIYPAMRMSISWTSITLHGMPGSRELSFIRIGPSAAG